MQVIDSSSIVHAWDNYPIQQFPKLRDWLGCEVAAGRLRVPDVALAEVMHVAPACRLWLEKKGIASLPTTNAIVHEAARIKTLLNIGPRYARGVDMNDLLIIASARLHSALLISNEAKQLLPPRSTANFRIPAVCRHPDVSVPCCDFLDYKRMSSPLFG